MFEAVVPAHAGVILSGRRSVPSALCGSRTRGGDPVLIALTAAALSGSRTRGGDPYKDKDGKTVYGWFPHTRG